MKKNEFIEKLENLKMSNFYSEKFKYKHTIFYKYYKAFIRERNKMQKRREMFREIFGDDEFEEDNL